MATQLPSAGKFLAGVALPAGAAAASQDPVDIATMFARLRSVPALALATYHPELNAGEAEWIAQRNRERDWEEAQKVNRRELTPQEQIANFEWQYPGTIERQLMLEYLRRQQEKQLPGPRRAPVQPVAQQEVRAIEPRRKADGGSVKQSSPGVNVPDGAQEFIDAVRKKFAIGGAVGMETTPDMSDGGNVIPTPEVGMSGGGDPGKKLKSVASMFKVLEKEPDLARRMLLNLPESKNLPAVVEKQSLPGIKDAPKVTEKTVELDPGEGKKKVTVKSLAETPVSKRVVYHAGADFETPNPGLFTTPDIEAAEKFLHEFGGSRLHTFHANPKKSGTDKDVAEVAKSLGIYDPKIPVGQYLEQSENAVFSEAPAVVRKLREKGLDSVVIDDGMSSAPSLVILDPAVLTRAPVSRRDVLQSAASQVARRALPSMPEVRVDPQELFEGASDWPSVYRAMLPVVSRYAPQEVKTLPERIGVTLEDLLAGTPEDPFVRSMPENMLRFQELFPETFKKVLGKAAGGSVDTSNMSQMVSNAMANGLSEPEAIKMLAPIFIK